MTLESSLARGRQHECPPVTGPAPCLPERMETATQIS